MTTPPLGSGSRFGPTYETFPWESARARTDFEMLIDLAREMPTDQPYFVLVVAEPGGGKSTWLEMALARARPPSSAVLRLSTPRLESAAGRAALQAFLRQRSASASAGGGVTRRVLLLDDLDLCPPAGQAELADALRQTDLGTLLVLASCVTPERVPAFVSLRAFQVRLPAPAWTPHTARFFLEEVLLRARPASGDVAERLWADARRLCAGREPSYSAMYMAVDRWLLVGDGEPGGDDVDFEKELLHALLEEENGARLIAIAERGRAARAPLMLLHPCDFWWRLWRRMCADAMDERAAQSQQRVLRFSLEAAEQIVLRTPDAAAVDDAQLLQMFMLCRGNAGRAESNRLPPPPPPPKSANTSSSDAAAAGAGAGVDEVVVAL